MENFLFWQKISKIGYLAQTFLIFGKNPKNRMVGSKITYFKQKSRKWSVQVANAPPWAKISEMGGLNQKISVRARIPKKRVYVEKFPFSAKTPNISCLGRKYPVLKKIPKYDAMVENTLLR